MLGQPNEGDYLSLVSLVSGVNGLAPEGIFRCRRRRNMERGIRNLRNMGWVGGRKLEIEEDFSDGLFWNGGLFDVIARSMEQGPYVFLQYNVA